MKSSKAELEKASLKANELALERTKVKEKLETVQKAKKAVEEARDRADSTGKMAAARLRLILIDEDVNEAEFEQFLDLLVEMSSNTALASIEFPMGEEAFEGLSPLQESVQWAISFCSLEQTTPYLHQSLDLHLFAMLEALSARVEELDAHKRLLARQSVTEREIIVQARIMEIIMFASTLAMTTWKNFRSFYDRWLKGYGGNMGTLVAS
ncbi:hypothetical protein E4T38_08743 [Aureobasidium subglaciale]|nr:hypothetical protein E4T38_08743 [Aureobasidium subglaciale]KAI5215400.1 hypothetical protein E4T40_08408 [Aureobasidium subglaciale]KAI5217974.1 hypothetical protein E4T41_08613 [Aureobasidium subglaciale]KAI5255632.1 hypothetical protein E4T46_08644 [Aureobasidium subglaciale]